jgi:carboxypeptidase C (cathepsin A)
MERCRDVVAGIKDGLSQRSSSQKDEEHVMRAMLNDPTYSVGIYDKTGKIGDYCPFEDSRKMVGSIINEATGISVKEANALATTFEFSKKESQTMVNISKEFVNTYLHTGRKLPLGGREKSNASLLLKEIKESEKKFPNSIGDATDKSSGTTIVPAHEGIKVNAPCPAYLKA